MILNAKQTAAIDLLERSDVEELLYGGAAGGGKSVLGCYFVLKNCFKYPKTRHLIGRATLKTLYDTTFKTFLETCAKQGLKYGNHFNHNGQKHVTTFRNGSEILWKDLAYYPSDPNYDELGSLELTSAFVDEVVQIRFRAFELLKSRIRYMLDNYGLKPKLVATCNPSRGWVYETFYLPDKNKKLPSHRAFVKATVSDNKDNVSKYYLESLNRMNPIDRARLLYGDWEYEDQDSLFNYEALVNAFTERREITGQAFITADIARMGGDRTVIVVWEGWKVVDLVIMQKQYLDAVAAKVKDLMNTYEVLRSRVIVDEDGVGGGVRDILNCIGFVNNSTPVEVKGKKQNFQNLKTQCFYHFAEIVNKGECDLSYLRGDSREDAIQELNQIKRTNIDLDRKLSITPKDAIKEAIGRSPDIGDALMFRSYFDLKKPREFFVA